MSELELDPTGEEQLRVIYSKDVIARLRRATQVEALARRLQVLTGTGLSEPAVAQQSLWLRAQRHAWGSYLGAALECGLLGGRGSKDLTRRLQSADEEQFRPAMAECQAAWYLRRKLGLEVTSRPIGKAASELALLVALPGGDVSVEVKSPFRDALADGVARTVHDSDILGQRVADASRQLDEKPCNLVMLVGRMTLGVEVRRFFIKAFYAAEVMVFDHATGRARTEFRDPGLFLKVWPGEDGPRHRRVGGVLYVEENIRSHESPAGALGMRAEHDALMMHNPMAHQPLPEAPWGDCPQFVPRGERMEWTDGQPAGGPYGLS